MFPGRSGRRIFLLLLPMVLWGLSSPLPPPRPLLVVGDRVYEPGQEILLLEGIRYPVKVELRGGLWALGHAPGLYKGEGSRQVFFDSSGFGIKGPWGDGGCFVTGRTVHWSGPFQPYPGEEGGFVLVVPWFTRVSLSVEVTKGWLCDVRIPSMTRIQKVTEEARGDFTLRVLEAREAWYRSLYVTAWGARDEALEERLDHLVFLMGLLEHQIQENQEGMVRLNLLAWRDALGGVKARLRALAGKGDPVGVWVRLLPSWRTWPSLEAQEREVSRSRACWQNGLESLGLKTEGPVAYFPFPLFSWGWEAWKGPSHRSLFPLMVSLECWDRWRAGVDRLVPRREVVEKADQAILEELGKGGTWQVGWVPWKK